MAATTEVAAVPVSSLRCACVIPRNAIRTCAAIFLGHPSSLKGVPATGRLRARSFSSAGTRATALRAPGASSGELSTGVVVSGRAECWNAFSSAQALRRVGSERSGFAFFLCAASNVSRSWAGRGFPCRSVGMPKRRVSRSWTAGTKIWSVSRESAQISALRSPIFAARKRAEHDAGGARSVSQDCAVLPRAGRNGTRRHADRQARR